MGVSAQADAMACAVSRPCQQCRCQPYCRCHGADYRRLLADHQTLAAGTGGEGFITPADYAYTYKSRADFEKDAFTFGIKRLGFKWRECEGEAVSSYEPAVAGRAGFIAAMADHGYLKSPGDYIKTLVRHFEKQGGRLVIADVDAVSREGGVVTGVAADGEWHHADRVAITTGVWSGVLTKQFGIKVPLESERGYHVELWNPSHKPKRPLFIASGKFVITPMAGRIRAFAGVVEFGGLKAGQSKAPFALLRRQLKENMPDLIWDEETEWMDIVRRRWIQSPSSVKCRDIKVLTSDLAIIMWG